MNQNASNKKNKDQVLYLDRWVPKAHFRVYVYNGSDSKLAESYEEYTALLASGLWKDQEGAPDNSDKVRLMPRKAKHGANS